MYTLLYHTHPCTLFYIHTSMYTLLYTHIHVHSSIYTLLYTHIHVHSSIYTHPSTLSYIHHSIYTHPCTLFYIHTSMYTFLYTHIHVHSSIYTHPYTLFYIHTSMYSLLYTHIHVLTSIYTHPCTLFYIHTSMYTLLYTHIHVHSSIYTLLYTHIYFFRTKYRVPWETLAAREKRTLVKTASKSYQKNPTNTNARKLEKAQHQLTGIYLKEQAEYVQNQIDKIRDSVEDRQSRIAWQTINEVSGRKSTAKAKLKAPSQQERVNLWEQHFKNLLGNPPEITDEPITRIISKQLDVKLGPFTKEELDSVLRRIKNRKAAGLDEIPPEVWKTRQFDDILLRQCNAVYSQNRIERWTKGCILPFPKKGDLGLAKNYRGITLTSIAAKIYNALLRNRIEPKIDNILRKNKNGFRRNRSTTSQILTIRRILEGVRAKNLQAT